MTAKPPEVSFRVFWTSLAAVALCAFSVGVVVDSLVRHEPNQIEPVEACLISYFQLPPGERTPTVLPDTVVADECGIPIADVPGIRSAFNPDLYEEES